MNDHHIVESVSTFSLPPIHISRYWFETVSEVLKLRDIEHITAIPDVSKIVVNETDSDGFEKKVCSDSEDNW